MLATSNFKTNNNIQIPNIEQKEAKPRDLRERLFRFSVDILFICKKLPNSAEFENIKKQLSKSVTSIAANFEEADGALSKKDFINKLSIARKEAKETKYWLRVLGEIHLNEIDYYLDESEQIIKILSSILFKSGYRSRLNNLQS
ncbi:four helix bundle protein [Candidatus Saganbacteria bacterium]|nr:four helix bundle protein [Candidatus Saganbacteria bacterium]